MRNRFFLLLFFFVCLHQPVLAADVLVDSPQKLEQAVRAAKAGDVITVAPGVYRMDSKTGLRANGESGKPITLRAAKLGDVIINSTAVELFVLSGRYWTVENLIVKGVCQNHSRCEHAFHIVGSADRVVIRNNHLRDFNAAIKANGQRIGKNNVYPNDVLIENNAFFNATPRATANPVTPIDVVGGDRWILRGNFIADFAKAGGNRVSYGAFLKGNSKFGVIERNLVMCEWKHKGETRVGLSLGGGGTGQTMCAGNDCTNEHSNGVLRNNIILNCSNDVGIYLNRANATRIYNNTLFNTGGIDVRFPTSSADIWNNLMSGTIRSRQDGEVVAVNNLQVDTVAPKLRGLIDAVDQKLQNTFEGRQTPVMKAAHSFVDYFFSSAFNDFFVDAARANFKPIESSAFVNKGAQVKDVTDDFCGAPRKLTGMDIGAIEFGANVCDVTSILSRVESLHPDLNQPGLSLVERQSPKSVEYYPTKNPYPVNATPPSGRVLSVGADKPYKRPSEASKAAQDGDVIEIDAGVYLGDVAVWTQNGIVLKGVGGLAQLRANGQNFGGKGIWVIKGDNVTVENIAFSGAEVPHRNGAGIRAEGRNLTVRHSLFHHNENGILANSNPESRILIEHCEFVWNGAGRGQTHHIYVNSVNRLTVRFSYFHRAVIGHQIKSRAAETHVLYNKIEDGSDGRSSYLVDISNGGDGYIVGNILDQGELTDNATLVAYALEGTRYRNGRLHVVNNTFINRRHWGIFVRSNGDKPALLANNLFVGKGKVVQGLNVQKTNLHEHQIRRLSVLKRVLLSPVSALRNPSDLLGGWFERNAGLSFIAANPYGLTPGSDALNAGTPWKMLDADLPVEFWQYEHPRGGVQRTDDGKIDIGAYEAANQSGKQLLRVAANDNWAGETRWQDKPTPKKMIEAALAVDSAVVERQQRTGRVLKVGPTRDLKRPSDAAKIAQDGDTVEIDAHDYKADTAVWRQNDLHLRGVNGRPVFSGMDRDKRARAIWVIEGNNAVVDNIAFSKVLFSRNTGAGIHGEGRDLTIRNSLFTKNQNGVIINGGGNILIENSEFSYNGIGRGRTHQIIIGNAGSAVIRNSYIHHGNVGHQIVSRARHTFLVYNYIADGPDGNASFSVNIENSANAFLIGNIFQKGPNARNSAFVIYATRGVRNPGGRLYVVNNSFLNDLGRGTFIVNKSHKPAVIANNIFVKHGNLASGPIKPSNNLIVRKYNLRGIARYVFDNPRTVLENKDDLVRMFREPEPQFMAPARHDFGLRPGASAINAGQPVFDSAGTNLLPRGQYRHPAGGAVRKRDKDIDLGAIEFFNAR